MYQYIKPIKKIIYFFFIVTIFESCKKFVQIGPPSSSITSATVYSTNTSAAAAVTGIYFNMMSTTVNLSGGANSIGTFAGLEADELKTNSSSVSATYVQLYTNSLTSSTNGTSNAYFWKEIFARLYETNAILDGINSSPNITDSIRQQLVGEAKFMRAFFNFYAINLYGDIPLVTTTDYQANNTISRSPSSAVYQQVLSDLNEAQTKLKDSYVNYQGLPSTARIRPNKAAATALLARVYCYLQKWDSAEVQASKLISDTRFKLADFKSSFTSTSLEAIWQLQPVLAGYNTFDGLFFVITAVPTPTTGPVSISDNLRTIFEAGDQRFTNWVGSYTGGTPSKTYYFPNKYKINKTGMAVSEYCMVLRLAEQYLIRAEARVQQNNITGALADLNTIRKRAGLLDYAGLQDKSSVLSAIMHERQVELFTEWGHRWFDLKRTKAIDSVMSVVCPQKGGGAWSPTKALMPLPLSEIQINSNLAQNPGYN